MDCTQLLARIRTVTQLSDADEDFTDTIILEQASDALLERFTQPIANLQGGYWLRRDSATTVQGQAKYRLPPRALVQGLVTAEISLDGAGNSFSTLDILTTFQAIDYSREGNSARPGWFTLEGDCIRLFPTPSTAIPLRYTYYLRPSRLVAASSATITAATTTSLTIGAPFLNQGSAGILDIYHTTGCNEVVAVNVAYTGVSTTLAVALTQEQLSQIVLGSDVVGVADTTDRVPLPVELHGALVSWTSATILADKGDSEKAAIFSNKAETAVKRIQDLAIPRVKTRPYAFKTRNSYLRARRVRT